MVCKLITRRSAARLPALTCCLAEGALFPLSGDSFHGPAPSFPRQAALPSILAHRRCAAAYPALSGLRAVLSCPPPHSLCSMTRCANRSSNFVQWIGERGRCPRRGTDQDVRSSAVLVASMLPACPAVAGRVWSQLLAVGGRFAHGARLGARRDRIRWLLTRK